MHENVDESRRATEHIAACISLIKPGESLWNMNPYCLVKSSNGSIALHYTSAKGAIVRGRAAHRAYRSAGIRPKNVTNTIKDSASTKMTNFVNVRMVPEEFRSQAFSACCWRWGALYQMPGKLSCRDVMTRASQKVEQAASQTQLSQVKSKVGAKITAMIGYCVCHYSPRVAKLCWKWQP